MIGTVTCEFTIVEDRGRTLVDTTVRAPGRTFPAVHCEFSTTIEAVLMTAARLIEGCCAPATPKTVTIRFGAKKKPAKRKARRK